MAERRMISKVISISEKVNSLSLFGRLLYTWMIPHADDFGRLPGSPAKVRALVVPMADETVKDVEEALADMHKKGLIIWYEVNGEKFIQITNFEKHQQGLHKRTKSKFPEPPEEFREIPGKSEDFPLEVEVEGKKNRNGTEKSTTTTRAREEILDDDYPRSVDEAFRRVFNLNVIPPIFTRFLAQVIPEYGEQYAIELILEAGESSRGQPNLRYIEQIHDGWVRRGIRSRAEAKRERDEQKRAPPAGRRSSQLDVLARLEKQFSEEEAEICDTG